MVIAGPSNYVPRFVNSLVIAFGSTALSIVLGTAAAYAFSRFKVPLKEDLLFFILSTRMMPPIAVAIPIYLMYRELGLSDTKLGIILLYTSVNVSLAVWLLKGFMDEIPREYEEAAMIDGYTRLQAFFKVVLPQATTGIVATAIFCLIFAWNEYAFAVLLTSGEAQTAPPFIPDHHWRRRPGLAGRCRRHDAIPDSHPHLHRAAEEASAERHHVWSCAKMRHRHAQASGIVPTRARQLMAQVGRAAHPLELVASTVIGAGVLMLLQPLSLTLYSYSFVTTLAGVVMFLIVSKVPE